MESSDGTVGCHKQVQGVDKQLPFSNQLNVGASKVCQWKEGRKEGAEPLGCWALAPLTKCVSGPDRLAQKTLGSIARFIVLVLTSVELLPSRQPPTGCLADLIPVAYSEAER
jgi:hypothetical protein|uniref:Uncharacterized protein n=1 Tax=Eutreptiella gymnastica TaxID=73025 RepID=A0A7S4LBY2_9EUGL|mmetsp:Transcript_46454/g.76110  ORF Transcript_46454/g.76110 Transcript_46454/m.76110 type:complete len:112 (+) Transcript_46454:82-417(+)|eukprot:CAMPEP_0174364464 /NCGR_PEP_ID=MMETSP0811_2-20130205/73001_1 /TAXON_ID=73025 ORGANISM="Eutreptiella gymnastica-like, Strain CCMP1594" /NCGR_SAMPLE_ID=MMETSP0811_2 /ASSEMBLY_ACC=CAM_ASM_000667 /LENGTH=111 /DNA_ID=CAMNT_0015504117 /DNA_START=74 /DNA_END=409 /DNA_ORIENTATION=+